MARKSIGLQFVPLIGPRLRRAFVSSVHLDYTDSEEFSRFLANFRVFTQCALSDHLYNVKPWPNGTPN